MALARHSPSSTRPWCLSHVPSCFQKGFPVFSYRSTQAHLSASPSTSNVILLMLFWRMHEPSHVLGEVSFPKGLISFSPATEAHSLCTTSFNTWTTSKRSCVVLNWICLFPQHSIFLAWYDSTSSSVPGKASLHCLQISCLPVKHVGHFILDLFIGCGRVCPWKPVFVRTPWRSHHPEVQLSLLLAPVQRLAPAAVLHSYLSLSVSPRARVAQAMPGVSSEATWQRNLILSSPGEPSLVAVLIMALSVSSSSPFNFSYLWFHRWFLAARNQVCSAGPYLTTCAVAFLTSVIILMYVLPSPSQSHLLLVRWGSYDDTSFLVLLLSTLCTALRMYDRLFQLWFFLCVLTKPLFVDTCDALNSAVLFVSSSSPACSAKRAASATSLCQSFSLTSSSASSATVVPQIWSSDLGKASSCSSIPTQINSHCSKQLSIVMVISLSRWVRVFHPHHCTTLHWWVLEQEFMLVPPSCPAHSFLFRRQAYSWRLLRKLRHPSCFSLERINSNHPHKCVLKGFNWFVLKLFARLALL